MKKTSIILISILLLCILSGCADNSVQKTVKIAVMGNEADFYPCYKEGIERAVRDLNKEYADSVYYELKNKGFRVEVDDRSEKIGYKIRSAQLEKIPYMLIVGEKEQGEKAVSVRCRKEGDKGMMPLGEFIDILSDEVEKKVIK